MSNKEGLSMSVRKHSLKEWDSVFADRLMDGAETDNEHGKIVTS